MKQIFKIVVILCLLFHFPSPIHAQTTSSPILFIYDASGSMWGQIDGKTKKSIASDVLASTINQLPQEQNIGLMAYGHRKEKDCDDVELILGLDNSSKEQLIDHIEKIKPLGRTPLARSAILAINNLRETKTKATIILVTDGIESCDGNICDIIQAAAAEGIEFKLHIVGFGLKEGESDQLKCAAEAGGGQYYDATDAEGLSEVLNQATSETIDEMPGNFSLYATKNGESVDAWIRAFKFGTREAVDFGRSYRDTAHIYLPPGKYDIEITPLENSDILPVSIVVVMKQDEQKHETISFDGGTLSVIATNNGEGWDAVVKMYDVKSGKVVASTRTYGRPQSMEVNAGVYDVSFQALAMKGMNTNHRIEKVKIKAGVIEELGYNFETGIAKIGVKTSDGTLIDATLQFTEIESGKWVAGGRTYTTDSSNPKEFLLNPGNYSVKLTTVGVHKGKTEQFNISVKTGETVTKSIIL